MAIIEFTVAQMRGVLTAERVFTGAANADTDTLTMMWKARDSPEYRDRLSLSCSRLAD